MILVTGASGMVGCQLIKKLLFNGYDFEVLLSPNSLDRRPWAKDIIPYNKVIYGDLKSKVEIYQALKDKRYDVVIHLAAKLSGKDVYKVNYYGTKYLLEALKDKINYFIFISSILALGDSLKHQFDENTFGAPVTEYERSKWDAERLVIEYSEKYNFKYVILRPPWIIGEYTVNPDILLLTKLLKKHISAIPISKNIIIHILYSGDLADAIVTLLEQYVNGVFHIHGGKYRMYELISAIKASLNTWSINITIPKSIFKTFIVKKIPAARYLILAPSEINIDKWIKTVGFKPRTILKEAVQKAIQWLENEDII